VTKWIRGARVSRSERESFLCTRTPYVMPFGWLTYYIQIYDASIRVLGLKECRCGVCICEYSLLALTGLKLQYMYIQRHQLGTCNSNYVDYYLAWIGLYWPILTPTRRRARLDAVHSANSRLQSFWSEDTFPYASVCFPLPSLCTHSRRIVSKVLPSGGSHRSGFARKRLEVSARWACIRVPSQFDSSVCILCRSPHLGSAEAPKAYLVSTHSRHVSYLPRLVWSGSLGWCPHLAS